MLVNRLPVAALLSGVSLLLFLAACSGQDKSSPSPTRSPPPEGNLFANPGLEDGSEPWFSLSDEASFVRTEEQAHSGGASAKLAMRDPAEATGAKVYYLVQEVTASEFPEEVRGFYRVDNWKKGTRKQYLQFVVIAFTPDNFPPDPSNWQLRYPLAGIDSPPFAIGNAHFVFITKEEPVQGQWVPFQANIKEDFQRLWGQVPEGFEKLRLLFEVRWDDKTPEAAAEADVYYDDLYVGRAAE